MFCIWLAWAFIQTKLPRPVQLFAFVLIAASAGMGFYQHVTYEGFPYGPYAALDQSIQNRLKQGDVVIHSNKLTYLPSFYFDRNLPQSYITDPPGSSTDTLSPATQKILNLTSRENIKSATADASRVWFIIFQQSIDEFTTKGYETHPDIEYLDNNFTRVSKEDLGAVKLFLYSKKVP
jgi:hypothetical protein